MRRSSDYNLRGARGQGPGARGQGSGIRDQGSEHYPLSTIHYSLPRSAFTLIEMLVVVSIMMILVAAGASVFRPANDSRRIREAARSINVYLSSARNRAMETGRPCGVMLRIFNGAAVMTLDQCEIPPCYCGENVTSVAEVTYNAPNLEVTFRANSSGTPETLPAKMVQPGDLIQLNHQGPMYSIDNPGSLDNGYLAGGTATVTAKLYGTATNQLIPWDATSKTVPFHIYRSPVKSGRTPQQLPASTVIDLNASGLGSILFEDDQDIMILFSPNGSVLQVYCDEDHDGDGDIVFPTEPIMFLVGKSERMDNGFTQDNADEPTMTNYQDLNNLWVVINPQTGLVSTAEIASSTGAVNAAAAIIAARLFARDLQGMGGK